MQTRKRQSIRIAVIDDSAAARDLLVNILKTDPDIEIVGTGADGHDAVRLVKTARPDILLVDIRMPRMDGFEATRQIMREAPLPIILISGSLMAQETDLTFKALQAGALAALRKPGINDNKGHMELIRTMRTMVDVPVIHHWGRTYTVDKKTGGKTSEKVLPQTESPHSFRDRLSKIEVIGIAASTGGPATLNAILMGLPKSYPVPIVIVQHISKGFDTGFAEWLGKQIQLDVVVGSQGDRLKPGTICVAPDDYHLEITPRGTITLSKDFPYRGLRPSANYMFSSLAKNYAEKCLGLILTGMGDDGVNGIVELHQSGGFVVAQDENSSVVYGMPKEAASKDAVNAVMSLEKIALLLNELTYLKDNPAIMPGGN